MKTLLRNFTKPYWTWKSELGSPWKNQITWADADSLQSIRYPLHIPGCVAVHVLDDAMMCICSKPSAMMISAATFLNDLQDCVCALVQACTHVWERIGKIEEPSKYPPIVSFQIARVSCRASACSILLPGAKWWDLSDWATGAAWTSFQSQQV